MGMHATTMQFGARIGSYWSGHGLEPQR